MAGYRVGVPRGLDTNATVEEGTCGRLRGTLSRWFLKPPDPDAPVRSTHAPRSVEELVDENRYADDRERMVGLIAAPVAAGIGFALARHAHGTLTSKSEVLIVALALALAMLAFAWFRQRMFLGIAMALYGISTFSLGYWGFAFPFVLFAAWLLVRAYRAQRDLHQADRTLPVRSGGQVRRRPPGGPGPNASKRYTPPAAARRGKPAPVRGSGGRKAS